MPAKTETAINGFSITDLCFETRNAVWPAVPAASRLRNSPQQNPRIPLVPGAPEPALSEAEGLASVPWTLT